MPRLSQTGSNSVFPRLGPRTNSIIHAEKAMANLHGSFRVLARVRWGGEVMLARYLELRAIVRSGR
jgi:hypothetical protein